jgi:Tol biopolymer transport system component
VQPLFAGAGRLLAYSYDSLGRVERVVAGGTRRSFATRGDLQGLAIGGGVAAAVSQVFVPGDGCGCLRDPVWSPDGSKIAYLEGTSDIESSNPWALGVMNADGSGRHEITASSGLGSVALADSPNWSPDGSKIAYGDPAGNIVVVNADGSGSQTLGRGDSPAWSPDGTKIAFASAGCSGAPAEISVMNPDGTNVQQLTSLGADSSCVHGIAWSPDGTHIAFGLNTALELMNANGSNLHQLGGGNEPAWSPDGSQIVFSSTNPNDTTYPNGGLWTIGADGSGLHQLTNGPDERPSWSPDGTTIVFASLRDDAYATNGIYNSIQSLELYLVGSDGSNLRPLSFTKPAQLESETTVGSARKHTTFAAPGVPRGVALAGKFAAVGSISSGTDQITLFDAHTGAQLTNFQVGDGQGFFRLVGGDAQWLVYEGLRTISAINTRTHEVIHLANLPEDTIDLSVSGRRVAWAEDYPGRKPDRKPDRGYARIRTVQLPR